MKERRFNILMLIFTGVAGILGFMIGEWIIQNLAGKIATSFLMGLYFGQITLLIGIASLLAEMISPKLNGLGWRNRYLGNSWKFLMLCTFVMLFLSTTIFQFFYGLDFFKVKRPDDFVVLIDISGSMMLTDPSVQRIRAAIDLVEAMEPQNRIALYAFDHEVYEIYPMTEIANKEVKDAIIKEIQKYELPRGGTDIGLALDVALKKIGETSEDNRTAEVILLSDGESNFNFNSTINPYIERDIKVQTVGLYPSNYDQSGMHLLRDIANATKGRAYSILDANDLSNTFNRIYKGEDSRNLVNDRNYPQKDFNYLKILRILLIACIGSLIGLSVGMTFDNRYFAKGFAIGGVVSGLLAGLILEFAMLTNNEGEVIYRLIAVMLLSTIFTIFSLLVKVQDHSIVSFSRKNRGDASNGSGNSLRKNRASSSF